MTRTGANDTLARPPVDRGESLRFALFWQDSGPRGAGMRPSQLRLKYGFHKHLDQLIHLDESDATGGLPMRNEERASSPSELKREKLNEHTMQSVYQAGYSLIKVNSVFGSQQSFPDLLYKIVLRQLCVASTSQQPDFLRKL